MYSRSTVIVCERTITDTTVLYSTIQLYNIVQRISVEILCNLIQLGSMDHNRHTAGPLQQFRWVHGAH